MKVSQLSSFEIFSLILMLILLSEVAADKFFKFGMAEGYLEDSCYFHPPSGSSATCYWTANKDCVTRTGWQLTNIPTEEEKYSGLTDDHSPSSDGYMWIVRKLSDVNTSRSRAFLEKRVRGGHGKIFAFWYHMGGESGTLSVSLVPLSANTSATCDYTDQNVTRLYTLHGKRGSYWRRTPDIAVAECQDYKILIKAEKTENSSSVMAVDDFIFTSNKHIRPLDPSPFVKRSELCWNEASYMLSKSNLTGHECCCKAGFGGRYCQMNLNECVTGGGNKLCSNEAMCLDLVNGFRCHCSLGYTGAYCQIDVDDCEGVLCEVDAKCRDLVNDYRCECPPGYSGKRCEQKADYCAHVVCLNGGTCIPLYQSYVCDCSSGYTGTWCEKDLDECMLYKPCGKFGTCIDGPGRLYWCLCPPGSEMVNTDDKQTCVDDFDSCKSSPCVYGGKCEDTLLAFECHCVPGTTGKYCQTDVNECLRDVCANGGTCIDTGRGSYQCRCSLGYEGKQCEKDVRRQLCVYKCKNTDICTYDGEVKCVCPYGYTGEICEDKINSCSYNPCVEGRCRQDSLSGYICDCYEGWTGTKCDQVFDFCSSFKCYTNSKCYNTHSGPLCVCDTGYTGSMCETYMSPCDRVKCLNGGRCIETGEKSRRFYCSCSIYFIGKYCEIEVAAQQDGTDRNGVKVIVQSLQQNSLAGGDKPDSQQEIGLCDNFWTLPEKLKSSILTVCISVNLIVLSLGCIIIELSARSLRHKAAHSDRR